MKWVINAPFGNREITFVFNPEQHDALENFKRFFMQCNDAAQEFGISAYSVDVYPHDL